MVVRVNEGAGAGLDLLSFWAEAGKKKPATKSKRIAENRMESLIRFTWADFAGETNSCLAANEVDITLVVHDRDRGPAITNVTGNAPALTH